MLTPTVLAARATRPPRVAAAPLPALEPAVARRLLADALLLGVAADTLLRPSLVGLALPLWITLVAATFLALTWHAQRAITREGAGWLGSAVLFAALVPWRDGELLHLAGIAAVLLSLLMAAITLRDRGAALFAARLRDLAWAARSAIGAIAAGWLPLALREAVMPGDAEAAGRRAGPVARAALLTLPLLLVFGALLRGADPVFASLVTLPEVDVGEVVSHCLLTAFFASLVAGWARAALDVRPHDAAPDVVPFRISALELTTALGALNALFAAFVLTQLGWFFGGERFLRERTGLTAAQYAREGFFQMLLVVLLVVPLLLATRAMLARGDDDLPRRHTLLSLPLLGLLGAMLLSAAARMQLYVRYYGLTIDRFYPMVLMAWLAVVLAWLALTVLRGRGERFVAGALLSGLATLAGLYVANPDAIVARVNVARAAEAPADPARRLDVAHLARLSGEAAPLAVAAVLATPANPADHDVARDRCEAAGRLLHRWGPASRTAAAARETGAWRAWNAGERDALRVVGAHSARLRAALHESCSAGGVATPDPEAS